MLGAEDVALADVARAIDIMQGACIEHVGLVTPRDNVLEKALQEPRARL